MPSGAGASFFMPGGLKRKEPDCSHCVGAPARVSDRGGWLVRANLNAGSAIYMRLK